MRQFSSCRASSLGAVVFKAYQPNQPTFLPPSLDELLSPHHLVRVVSVAIDRMDISPLVAAYPGGGASSYHPKMMLKVLVYAYMQRIYSSRQIVQGDYRSDNGCRTSRRVYQVDDCSGCPVMESCLPKGTKRRRVAIGDALQAYRAAARERLHSYQGQILRQRHSLDAEPVFADSLTPSTTVNATLTPAPDDGAMFRHDVALSGDYLVVGDPFLDSDTRGAFAVWKRSTNVWSRVTYAAAAPNRGFAVAVSDSFVVIGDNA